MRLLLDTHALLWWLKGEGLSPAASDAIGDSGNDVWVSSATIWEASIKAALGKISYSGSLADAVRNEGFNELPISLEHAERAGGLDPHHCDPFDRMLVAQAGAESLTIVSRDQIFDAYSVARLPC